MTESQDPGTVTALLALVRGGDTRASAELFQLLYLELRATAAQAMGGNPHNSLTPSGLVHELFIKLASTDKPAWNDRRHFFAVAATAMRQIIVDHARARRAQIRDVRRNEPLSADSLLATFEAQHIDVLAVHDALDRLNAVDPVLAKLVELHYFSGLTLTECGPLLDLSERTTTRYWQTARAWLRRELEK